MRADCGSGRPGGPEPAPLPEPHLGGSDGEGGVGQLLILRLLPGQSGSIFHLFELVGKLEKQSRVWGHGYHYKLILSFLTLFFLDSPDAAAAP